VVDGGDGFEREIMRHSLSLMFIECDYTCSFVYRQYLNHILPSRLKEEESEEDQVLTKMIFKV
jgi:hypothetical protein